jgi:CubicO group peptidase (beta-lactamase class C family)
VSIKVINEGVMKSILMGLLGFLISTYASANTNLFNEVVMKSIHDSGFNGSIVIGKQGAVIYQKYIGYSDKKNMDKLTVNHIFSPGSVGKEFTTVTIMQLIEQGRLSYSDKITKYLDWLPEEAEKVTVEHILTHTSGLPKIKWKRNINTADAVEQIKNSQLSFAPGEGYLYSNLNVVLRALIVEKVSGDSYSNYLKNSVFDVADMKSSYQQLTESDVSDFKVHGDYPTYLLGTTIYVTPMDLLKFENALWSGALIQVDELKRVLDGERLSGKANHAYFDFGKFYKDSQGKLVSWEHDGSNPNHHTLKFHDFINDYTIVIMSSDGNKETLYKIRDNLKSLIINKS